MKAIISKCEDKNVVRQYCLTANERQEIKRKR